METLDHKQFIHNRPLVPDATVDDKKNYPIINPFLALFTPRSKSLIVQGKPRNTQKTSHFNAKISRTEIIIFEHFQDQKKVFNLEFDTGTLKENGQIKSTAFGQTMKIKLLQISKEIQEGMSEVFEEI